MKHPRDFLPCWGGMKGGVSMLANRSAQITFITALSPPSFPPRWGGRPGEAAMKGTISLPSGEGLRVG